MAQIKIHPDGSVETRIGTQDIGTGSRTVVLIATSKWFGYLPLEKIRVEIGDSDLPPSSTSAGSGTTGSVWSQIKRAAEQAQQELFEQVAPKLKAAAGELEIRMGGRIGIKKKPEAELSWEEATSSIHEIITSHVRREKDTPLMQYVMNYDGSKPETTFPPPETEKGLV
jgi:xanthine dehydrogenase YagR molybdenum-binding subunit